MQQDSRAALTHLLAGPPTHATMLLCIDVAKLLSPDGAARCKHSGCACFTSYGKGLILQKHRGVWISSYKAWEPKGKRNRAFSVELLSLHLTAMCARPMPARYLCLLYQRSHRRDNTNHKPSSCAAALCA